MTQEVVDGNIDTEAQEEFKGVEPQLDQLLQEADRKLETLNNLVSQIQDIKTASETLKNSIDTDIKSINNITNTFQQLETQAKERHGNLQTELTALEEKAKVANEQHSNISLISKRLLEDTKDENGNIINQSLNNQILAHHATLSAEVESAKNTRETISKQFDELKKSLEAEIKSLLPGAATAALAYGYVESKARYGALPYDEKANTKKTWSNNIFVHFIKGNAANVFNYALFLVPLFFIIGISFNLYGDIHRPDFNKNVLLFRLFVAIPFALISWFGLRTINLNRRMYEEYNHKQRVMQLYHGFKEELEKHNDSELKKGLIEIMLHVVKDKPSLAMTQYDRGPEGFIPRFFSSSKKSTPE